jgi:hypothetical protein
MTSSMVAIVKIYLQLLMTGTSPLVQPEISLHLTALCLQRNLVQLVLVEDVHATRHESEVGIPVGYGKDTKQNAFRVPTRIFKSALLRERVSPEEKNLHVHTISASSIHISV